MSVDGRFYVGSMDICCALRRSLSLGEEQGVVSCHLHESFIIAKMAVQ